MQQLPITITVVVIAILIATAIIIIITKCKRLNVESCVFSFWKPWSDWLWRNTRKKDWLNLLVRLSITCCRVQVCRSCLKTSMIDRSGVMLAPGTSTTKTFCFSFSLFWRRFSEIIAPLSGLIRSSRNTFLWRNLSISWLTRLFRILLTEGNSKFIIRVYRYRWTSTAMKNKCRCTIWSLWMHCVIFRNSRICCLWIYRFNWLRTTKLYLQRNRLTRISI